jgi:hypothetical protein
LGLNRSARGVFSILLLFLGAKLPVFLQTDEQENSGAYPKISPKPIAKNRLKYAIYNFFVWQL